jgi:glycosyltransferase involved in cell wall biosynthesis
MKILHVTEAYGGGVLTVLNQLISAQVASGHEVVLALRVREEAPSDWRSVLPHAVKTIELPLVRNLSPVSDFQGLMSLVRVFKCEAPDAIHLHSSKAGFLGRVAAKLLGQSARIFYSPHAFAFLSPTLSRGKRHFFQRLERVGGAFGGLVVACSQDELEVAVGLGLKAIVVNNAVDQTKLNTFFQLGKNEGSGRTQVMSAGRVCAAKRPDFFVAVAEEASRRGLAADFTWIGGGEPFPETSCAQATGWLPRDETLAVLARHADIYVQTSTYEGLPMAILEAQSLGIPAVVTNAVGNRSAIADGVTGFVAPVDDVSAFVDRLEKLIVDGNLRRQMGAASRSRAKAAFDLDAMVKRYDAVYRGEAA